MWRFGPDHGPTLIVALPLFEEANRTRTALVDVLRRLADRGIASALPDLPGTGESLVPVSRTSLADWRAAFAAAVLTLPGPVHSMAWRAGALLDAEADVASRWYLSPLSGAEQGRELERVRHAAASDDYAGNMLSDDLLAELAAAEPSTLAPLRIVRLESDPRPADHHLPAAPLWRAAEPGVDPALQQAIADDVADWIARCDG